MEHWADAVAFVVMFRGGYAWGRQSMPKEIHVASSGDRTGIYRQVFWRLYRKQ